MCFQRCALLYLATLTETTLYAISIFSYFHKSPSRAKLCKSAFAMNTMLLAWDSCFQLFYVYCISPYQIRQIMKRRENGVNVQLNSVVIEAAVFLQKTQTDG